MKLNNKILYLSFHNSIKKKFGVNRIISKKEIIIKLGRQFLVPKRLRIVALKELEQMGLFKEIDNENYLIIDYDLDIEEDCNKFLKQINLL